MTPADVARLIRLYGETATLRREGAPNVDVAVKGRMIGSAASQLVGEISQSTRQFVIGNAEILAAAWPGPPKKGDRIIQAGGAVLTILDNDEKKLGDETAGHWLTVKG